MKVDTINAMCTVTHICFCFIRLTRCIHSVIRKTVNFLWNSFISSNFVKMSKPRNVDNKTINFIFIN